MLWVGVQWETYMTDDYQNGCQQVWPFMCPLGKSSWRQLIYHLHEDVINSAVVQISAKGHLPCVKYPLLASPRVQTPPMIPPDPKSLCWVERALSWELKTNCPSCRWPAEWHGWDICPLWASASLLMKGEGRGGVEIDHGWLDSVSFIMCPSWTWLQFKATKQLPQPPRSGLDHEFWSTGLWLYGRERSRAWAEAKKPTLSVRSPEL